MLLSIIVTKFFCVVMISLFNIYAIDIYPTTINGIGTGILRFFGQIGASLAVIPYADTNLIFYGDELKWQIISFVTTLLLTIVLLVFLKDLNMRKKDMNPS